MRSIHTMNISLRKKLNSEACYNVDEPWKQAKWNKPDTKGQILCDSAYMNSPE